MLIPSGGVTGDGSLTSKPRTVIKENHYYRMTTSQQLRSLRPEIR